MDKGSLSQSSPVTSTAVDKQPKAVTDERDRLLRETSVAKDNVHNGRAKTLFLLSISSFIIILYAEYK